MLFRIAASVLVVLCIVATLFMMGEDTGNQQPVQTQNPSITPQGNKNFNF